MSTPQAFISHSQQDKAVASQIAERLQANGIRAWIDEWEIMPGDSIVHKIFEEGLKNCTLFLVLLSPASVRSPWVKHELDAAIVQRLAGTTRVIPIVVSPCDIPTALRPLLRLDLGAEGLEGTVGRLVDVAFDRDRRPPLAAPLSDLNVAISGLTSHSARLAILLANSMDQPDGRPIALSGDQIKGELLLSPEQVNDSVEELESLGLVRTTNWLGTAPYRFGQVEPTVSLAFHLRGAGVLRYDPEEDVKVVAAAITQVKVARGPAIHDLTQLPPSRINRAVSYLESYSLAVTRNYLGTAPYDFGEVHATGATRRFVSENA